jgi:hypothetical protein
MVQALVQGLVQGRYPLLITTEGLKPLEAPPESRESPVSASEGEGKGEHTPRNGSPELVAKGAYDLHPRRDCSRAP